MASAARVVCPSAWLRELVIGWGVDPGRVEVLPHALAVPPLGGREELRRRYGFEGPTLVLAGRLVPQKSLDVALRAVSLVEDVSLVVAGEGPERGRAQALAVQLGLGNRPASWAPSRATRCSSSSGPPTQRSSRRAGRASGSSSPRRWPSERPSSPRRWAASSRCSRTAANGLLVPVGDHEALAAAIRRFFADAELQARLRAAAAPSVERLAPERIYARLERILEDAAKQ